MKNYLLLVVILGAYFWFGVATSPDVDFQEYPATVEALADAIVLTSQSEVAIEGAFLSLIIDSLIINSATSDSIVLPEGFNIFDYDLVANGRDTIPFSDFLSQDSIPFPSGQSPDRFRLDFFANDIEFFITQDF